MRRRSLVRIVGPCCLLLLFGCAAAPAGKQAAANAEQRTGRALEPRFARYLEECVAKIERVESTFYPLEAPRGIYGTVQLSVSIKPDGSVAAIDVARSSGHDALDRAAMRIVELASPFPPFPPEIREDTDTVVVTRSWTFSPGGWIRGP
jgi:protein TonB